MVNRRDFIKMQAVGLAGLPIVGCSSLRSTSSGGKTRVALVKTTDRKQGVAAIMKALDYPSMKGKRVVVKPNFNTADPTPAGTHNDTLMQLISEIRSSGGEDITLTESSGPPATRTVMEQKGTFRMAEELKFSIVNLEEIGPDQWFPLNPDGSHWEKGFSIPRMVNQAEYLVSTPCLKTHGSGGHISMALKLAVGLTPKNIRRGMHALRDTSMRDMIAELNLGYTPQMIIMDGIEVFTDGGPSKGTLKRAEVFIGGTDRIAVDAVGVAVLKDLLSNSTIMGRRVFQQDQIRRAVELGLGISGPDQIEFVTIDKPSREYAKKLEEILALA
jgi:uncharacterized protein (DUF362 family)